MIYELFTKFFDSKRNLPDSEEHVLSLSLLRTGPMALALGGCRGGTNLWGPIRGPDMARAGGELGS